MAKRLFGAMLLLAAVCCAQAPTATISLTSAALQFNYSGSSTLPSPQTVQLRGTKSGLTYSMSVPGAATWLIPVSPSTGNIPANLSFRVNPSSLQAGTYNTDVTITSAGASNTLTLRITLVVRGAAPVLAASPTSVEFEYFTSGLAPAAQKLNITSAGQSAAVSLSAQGASWLKLSKSAGFTVAGAPLVVDLTIDTAVLVGTGPKVYETSVVLAPTEIGGTTLKIPVKLTVRAGLPVLSSIWPDSVPDRPGPITLTLTGSNFLKESKVFVNATELPAASVTLVSNSLLLAALPSTGVLDTQGSYNITVRNDALQSAAQVFTVNAPGPYVAGITNAGSYRATDKVSPGEIISVFGTAFGPTELTAGTIVSNRYQKVIADTAVQFWNGTTWMDAPLIFASGTQINAVTPYALPVGSTRLRVAKGVSGTPTYSNELTPMTVTAANPGIFTVDGSGQGPAAAVNVVTDPDTLVQTRSLNSSKNPVPKGAALEIYLTGAGTLAGGGVDGDIMTASPIVYTDAAPAVTLNGVACPGAVAFAAPDSIRGLIQVNVTVPADMASGNAHPLVISFGGQASQTVTVAVK